MEVRETERLRLERWRDTHVAGLAAMNADPEVMRFVGGGTGQSRREAAEMGARIAAHWDVYGFGLWAVLERAGGAMVGFAGLSHPLWFPTEVEHVEVGWRLRRDAWGRGYATEAGRAAIATGFGALGLETVVSYIHPANVRSVAVAERLGMRRVREVPHPTRAHAVAVYELVAPS